MKQAIQETLGIHHAAEAAGMLYSEHREDQNLRCPLCVYAKKYSDSCAMCPWVAFEGELCSSLRYNSYIDSIPRLTRWLSKCSHDSLSQIEIKFS
jgi:hypothetical protein